MKLAAFERSSGAQIVILLVPSTLPEDTASYANRGAKSLEGAIPDLAVKQVIDEAITLRFRQGDFAGGLDAAIDLLMTRITAEALLSPVAKSERSTIGFQWPDLAVFLFIVVPLMGGLARRVMGRNLGSVATGGGISHWQSGAPHHNQLPDRPLIDRSKSGRPRLKIQKPQRFRVGLLLWVSSIRKD